MKKKLLIYTMIMTKGGSERVIANLANHFIDYYDITIVTNIKHECEYQLNSKIKFVNIDNKNKKNEKLFLKIFTKLSLKRSKILKQIIKDEKPDVILSFLPEPTIRMLSLKKAFPNIKMILSIRNHPKKEFIYPFSKLIRDYYYKKADKIIIQDESYCKYLNNNIQDKIIVIPNFLSTSFTDVEKVLQKEKIIVTVARLEKQKNLKLLIKSFHKLDKRFNNYKLYIYGDGNQKKQLLKMIKKLKLGNRVFIIEKEKNIPGKIKKASLFVLPSNYEGMPNSLLEAMALSLPVITTNSTEVINSMIENNINGIIVEKRNRKMLTEKIEYLLDNPQIALKLGLQAENVKQKYNQKKIIKKWYKVLDE